MKLGQSTLEVIMEKEEKVEVSACLRYQDRWENKWGQNCDSCCKLAVA